MRASDQEALGLEIAVVVRSRAELARIVKRNPLGKVATEPKRYQVTFLSAKLSAKVVRELEAAAAESEQVVVSGQRSMAGARRRSPARNCGRSSPARAWASPPRRETGQL